MYCNSTVVNIFQAGLSVGQSATLRTAVDIKARKDPLAWHCVSRKKGSQSNNSVLEQGTCDLCNPS